MSQQVDVLILGAGAAGLMAGIGCARRNRRTLVLDHADRAGKKILISGGGRCNFTNLRTGPENFLSNNPHFAKSALARFTPQDFLGLVEKHGIPYHEKTLGQLFCDRSAHDILNMLLADYASAKGGLQLSTRVDSIERKDGGFLVETSTGTIAAEAVIVATGGLSIPKMGATPLGYDIARQFGHGIVATRPALVPLVFSAADKADWCDLAGLSTEAAASIPQAAKSRNLKTPSFREKILITHRGLSGPAILQISSYWHPGQSIEIDLAREHGESTGEISVLAPLLEGDARRNLGAVGQALRAVMPGRFADRWRAIHARGNPADAEAYALSNSALAAIEHGLRHWRVIPAGTEGYDKAEVTAGGVDTDSLDARTMQSRIVPNLYFIGEVVDVTGWLGGYNFQWAWASGHAAGECA